MTQTICLVDDNEDILGIFSMFFGKKGYTVVTASGGQGCIDTIRVTPPDIIILDVMMEPMDGWKTLEQVKSNPATRHIPVIMVSGKRPTAEELNAYGTLFVRYIMKPVSFHLLHEAVTGTIGKRPEAKI